MRRKTKTALMWVGGAAAVGAIGYFVYKSKHPTPTTPAALPPGSPIATLTSGQKYTFGALLPTGIADQPALTAALTAAGWSNVRIIYFMGQGPVPAGLTAPGAGGYIATGTWNGLSGAPVPAGLVAMASS